MAKGADKVNIFISYSHKDKRWLAEFQKILKPLERTGKLIIWDDTRIRAGAKWREEIAHALSTADAAVLLVSPDFIASDFIAEHELPPLLEGAENRGVQVFWVAVSACPYEETDVARYQAANDPRRPLDKLRRSALNQELTSIARKIAVARQVAPEVIAEPEEWEQRQKALERSAPRAAIGVGRDSNAGATPEFVRLLVSCRPEEDYGLFLPVLGLQCKTTNLHPDGSALFDKPHFRIGLRELFPGAFTAKGGMSQDATSGRDPNSSEVLQRSLGCSNRGAVTGGRHRPRSCHLSCPRERRERKRGNESDEPTPPGADRFRGVRVCRVRGADRGPKKGQLCVGPSDGWMGG